MVVIFGHPFLSCHFILPHPDGCTSKHHQVPVPSLLAITTSLCKLPFFPPENTAIHAHAVSLTPLHHECRLRKHKSRSPLKPLVVFFFCSVFSDSLFPPRKTRVLTVVQGPDFPDMPPYFSDTTDFSEHTAQLCVHLPGPSWDTLTILCLVFFRDLRDTPPPPPARLGFLPATLRMELKASSAFYQLSQPALPSTPIYYHLPREHFPQYRL